MSSYRRACARFSASARRALIALTLAAASVPLPAGLELNRRSAAQPLVNVDLANGWYGYSPPPEEHRLGA